MSTHNAEVSTRVEVRKDVDHDRFVIFVDDEPVGFVTFHDRGDVRALPHTEIDDAYQGKGLAGRLIRETLDQTRAEGMHVLPFCPAVRGYIVQHPEYVDLVPADRRAEFELS